jgi:hypothetical protein
MLGPYALIGSSYFKMVEGNATHLARCIEAARERDATCVEIRRDVHDRYFEDIQRRQQNTVFLNHNCGDSNSYYFDRHGDAPMPADGPLPLRTRLCRRPGWPLGDAGLMERSECFPGKSLWRRLPADDNA